MKAPAPKSALRAAACAAVLFWAGGARAGDALLEQAIRSKDPNEQVALCGRILDEARAAKNDFRDGQAHLVRANAYSQLRRYDEALADADAAVREIPKDAGPLITRAWVRHHDCAGSLADLESALKVASAGDRSLVYYTRAEFKLECQDRAGALQDLRAAAAAAAKGSDPSPVSARMALGTLLCEDGKAKEARRWFAEAAAVAPGPEPRLRLGVCLYDAGLKAQARKELDAGLARLSSKPAVSETKDAYFVADLDRKTIVKALRRRALLRSAKGDASGALDDLYRGAEYVTEPPSERDSEYRREAARLYTLRGRLLADKGDAAFAAEDRRAACRWSAAECATK